MVYHVGLFPSEGSSSPLQRLLSDLKQQEKTIQRVGASNPTSGNERAQQWMTATLESVKSIVQSEIDSQQVPGAAT